MIKGTISGDTTIVEIKNSVFCVMLTTMLNLYYV